MDGDEGSERSSLSKSAQKGIKYGTTRSGATKEDLYLKYKLSKGDTIQGLALKFNTTVEKLKSANNLWTNDNLHILDYVYIPTPPPTSTSSQLNNCHVNGELLSNSMSQEELVTKKELKLFSAKKASKIGASNGASSSTMDYTADFLSKYDTSLEKIRSNVNKLESSSYAANDNGNPLSLLPSRRRQRPTNGRSLDYGDCDDPSGAPSLRFTGSRSKSFTDRKLRSSLEQLHPEEDLFQL